MQSNHLKPASNLISPESLFDYQRFEHYALFDDIAYVWDALKRLADYIEQYLKNPHQRNDVTIMPGAVVAPNVVFGEHVTVEPHVYIKGPAIIGDRTEIRHGAYIRENVIVGRDCIIGNTTEVKHSIIMDCARASHWNYIGDSIVGFGVNLGAGVKLSNRKITSTEIKIRDSDGNAYATGLLKLGAIIGDETQLGCNAVLNPGTLLGKRCLVYPLVSAFGTYSHGKVIK